MITSAANWRKPLAWNRSAESEARRHRVFSAPMDIRHMLPPAWLEAPRPNVRLGTSVEDRERAGLRIPNLVQEAEILGRLPVAQGAKTCNRVVGAQAAATAADGCRFDARDHSYMLQNDPYTGLPAG